ncbi:restriction endonuclease subunit S, partial [Bifidobacterium olomucense]|nr:n-6 DNA Methylase [Bifidobacterium sp. DSM 109959]
NLKAILGDKATLRHDDYIAYSKNKNEIRFENNSKTTISPIIRMLLPMWKQVIYQCNEDSKTLLAELRDALLPKLMNGELDVSKIEAPDERNSNEQA